MSPAKSGARFRVFSRSRVGARELSELALAAPYAPDENEHAGQAALFQWAAYQGARFPELERLLFAVPNGGQRSKATAGKLRAEGAKAGTPDVFLAVPRRGYGALIIENKKRGGTLEPEQRAFIEAAAMAGNLCAVSYAWEAARDLVAWYLGDPDQDKSALSLPAALGWAAEARP